MRGIIVGRVVLSIDEYENLFVELCELFFVIDDFIFIIDEDD